MLLLQKEICKRNKELYGEDYYRNKGRIGDLKSRGGGLASNKVGKDGMTGRERGLFYSRERKAKHDKV